MDVLSMLYAILTILINQKFWAKKDLTEGVVPVMQKRYLNEFEFFE
jgi:hypothetical protein